jgi:hypothetical protein
MLFATAKAHSGHDGCFGVFRFRRAGKKYDEILQRVNENAIRIRLSE